MDKKSPFWMAFFLLAVFAVTYYSCVKDQGRAPAAPLTLCDSLAVAYSKDIMPIIQTTCVNNGCHAAGGGTSGYDLSTYQLLKSFADGGRIRARVIDGATNGWMPQAGPLPLPDRQKIDCWLNAGSPNN